MNESFKFKKLDKPVGLLLAFTTEMEGAKELDERLRRTITKKLDDVTFESVMGFEHEGGMPFTALTPIVEELTLEGVEITPQIAFAIGAYFSTAKHKSEEKAGEFSREYGAVLSLAKILKPEDETLEKFRKERDDVNMQSEEEKRNHVASIIGCSGDCDHCSEEDKKKLHGAMNTPKGIISILDKISEQSSQPEWAKEMIDKHEEEGGKE
jgi:hypothetical protein